MLLFEAKETTAPYGLFEYYTDLILFFETAEQEEFIPLTSKLTISNPNKKQVFNFSKQSLPSA